MAVRRDHALRDGRLPRSLPQLPHAAADGGQAPVAVESGKAKRAQFRWACDHRLRAAFDTLADSSRRHSPWAADIYDRARARGASHPHAARILGRAWCQVIWRLWQDHDTYNPRQTHRPTETDRRGYLTNVGPPGRRPSHAATAGAAVTAGCPQGRARSA